LTVAPALSVIAVCDRMMPSKCAVVPIAATPAV
jgi:hypothetical protein